MIDQAKGWYQHLKAAVPARAASLLTPYRPAIARSLAVERVQGRTFRRAGRLNYLMVVPIVNWETALLQHAASFGACHHLDLGARGFFESAVQWKDWRRANVERIYAFVNEREDPDALNVLFLYLSDFFVDPDLIAGLRRNNVVVVNFNWDDVLHYCSSHLGQDVGVRRLARAVDLNLTMALAPLSRYARDGAPAFYWYGAHAAGDPQPALPPVEYDRVLFFGCRYGFRAKVVDYLSRRGLPLDVYGAGWGTTVISYDELAHKIPRYAVNLGVSTIGYTRRLYLVKGRDIEVPLAGGLYLTNDSREIRHVYQPNRDILAYRSLDDCYRKASEVIEDPAAYAAVRENGARRARSFSWQARFRFLNALLRDITRT